MIASRARTVTIAYLISDVLTTVAALFVAHALRAVAARAGDSSLAWLGPVAPFSHYALLLLFILPTWGLVFHTMGLYGSKAARTLRTEVSRVVQAMAICGLLLAFAIFALRLGDSISRPVVLLFLLLNGIFIEAGRSTMRAFILGARARRHVLIAGGRDEVARTATEIESHRDWGLEIVGVVSDGTWEGRELRSAHPFLGALDDVPRLARSHVIDEILIAPAGGRIGEIKTLEPLLLTCEEEGILTRLLLNFLPGRLSQVSLEEFGGLPLLTLSSAPHNELLLFTRRCADAVLAFVLLVIFSPVFLVISIAVRATSAGPVLFRQTRCGLHGRPFEFLKFRSMRLDAESIKPSLAPYNEMDGPAFKMTDDPRVTPIGRFLRRTSLDELPQLWNILRGEMSFVGPRPAVLEEVRQYEPWQRRRLSMPPGLTCLWQVSGRNELTFDEWMKLDLEYIDNWSLWLDVKIALKTIPAVFQGRGAK